MLRQFEIYVLLCFPFVNLLLRGDDNVFFFVFVFVFRLLLRTLLLSFSWLPFSCKAIDNASTKWLFSASLAIPKYPPSSSWSSLSEEPAMYSSKYSLHSTRNNGNKRIKAARVKMRGHSMLHGSGGWYWFGFLFFHESVCCSVDKKVYTVFRNDSSTTEAQGSTCLTATALLLCNLYRSCGAAGGGFFC
mgnify:CR=1 FL=1